MCEIDCVTSSITLDYIINTEMAKPTPVTPTRAHLGGQAPVSAAQAAAEIAGLVPISPATRANNAAIDRARQDASLAPMYVIIADAGDLATETIGILKDTYDGGSDSDDDSNSDSDEAYEAVILDQFGDWTKPVPVSTPRGRSG